MAKVYLAGPYTDRLLLAGYAYELLQDGHAVTSRWLWGNHPYGDDVGEAYRDLADVQSADVLVVFTEGESPGGRYVELGAALAWEKRVYVVGSTTNLFTHLADCVFKTWDDCRCTLYVGG